MLQFLVGFAVGAWATAWYKKSKGNENLDRRVAEIQARMNTVAGEARRVVDDFRKGMTDQFADEEPPAEEPPDKESPDKEETGPAASS